MKKALALVCVAGLTAFNVIAADNLDSITNPEKPFEKAVTLKGVARPIVTTTIKAGFNDAHRGIITYTAAQGSIFWGPIFDDQGKIEKKGDVLVTLKTDYREAILKAKKAALMEAEANLLDKEENYKRYNDLVKTKAVSVESDQNTREEYYDALAALEEAKADMVEIQNLLDLCTYHAQFTGIVDKVLHPAGLCPELDVIQVSQLFPIGIDVELPREIVNKITVSTPISIYSEFSEKPIGVAHGYSVLTDNGIRFTVDNFPLEHNVNGLKNVHESHTVVDVQYFGLTSKNKLSVEKEAILRDDKGCFVWKAVGQKNLIPGRAIDHVFKVEKVRVTPGVDAEKLEPGVRLVSLLEYGSLEENDVVISDIPKDFKDGSEVYFSRQRFLFMPGDPVKVVIGSEK